MRFRAVRAPAGPLALCAWLGLAVAFPAAAAAQTTPSAADRAEARQRFQRGVAAFQRRAWEDALESFQQAYRLAPHPSVRVNMANCYVELRRPVEAIFHFEQYLAETPDAENPQRTAVQNHLRELRQRVTEVTISVSPTNAAGVTATVDGLAVALDRTVRLAPGRHTLEVLAEGYFPARQDFDGPGGGQQRLTIALQANAATAATASPPATPQPGPSVPTATPPPTVAATPPATPPTAPASTAAAPPEPPPAPALVAVETGSSTAPLSPPEPRPTQGQGLFWTAAGVTAVAVVATGVFGSLALSANGEFDDAVARVRSGQGDLAAAQREGDDAADRASRYALFADVALGTAIVGAAASTVLFFHARARRRVEVTAAPTAQGASFALTGRF